MKHDFVRVRLPAGAFLCRNMLTKLSKRGILYIWIAVSFITFFLCDFFHLAVRRLRAAVWSCVGIGRRGRLKICCWKQRVGSSPTWTTLAGRLLAARSGSYPDLHRFDSCSCNSAVYADMGSILISDVLNGRAGENRCVKGTPDVLQISQHRLQSIALHYRLLSVSLRCTILYRCKSFKTADLSLLLIWCNARTGNFMVPCFCHIWYNIFILSL